MKGETYMDAIVNLVTQVGFPIAISLILLWYTKSLIDSHKEETKEFTQALNNNTLVLQSLRDKLDEVTK